MAAKVDPIPVLGLLIEEWRHVPAVLGMVRELTDELAAGTEPFVGRPLPDVPQIRHHPSTHDTCIAVYQSA